jgi:hypothetical protein
VFRPQWGTHTGRWRSGERPWKDEVAVDAVDVVDMSSLGGGEQESSSAPTSDAFSVTVTRYGDQAQ